MQLTLGQMRQHSTYAPPGAIVCRYADKGTVLFYYVVALAAVGAVIYLVYTNEAVGQFLARRSHVRDERMSMLAGFSLIWAAILADFLLQALAFLRNRPAIIVTAESVSGLHGGLWREIAWEDLWEIEIADAHIRFVRRPRNALTRFTFGRQAAGWSRYRLGEYCIHVLLKRIDGGRTEILRAVQLHRPDLL